MNRRGIIRAALAAPALIPGASLLGIQDTALARKRTDAPLAASEDDLTFLICFRRVPKDHLTLKLSDAHEVRDGAFVGETDFLVLARMLVELSQERGEFGDSPERRDLFQQITTGRVGTSVVTNLPSVETFKELEVALSKLPDQCIGQPMSVCENGMKYVAVQESALARPSDTAAIEAMVARRMATRLSEALSRADGRIYWRIPFEYTVEDTYVVERFDDNGPDVDFLTNRRCFVDKNWKRVAAYARLARSLG